MCTCAPIYGVILLWRDVALPVRGQCEHVIVGHLTHHVRLVLASGRREQFLPGIQTQLVEKVIAETGRPARIGAHGLTGQVAECFIFPTGLLACLNVLDRHRPVGFHTHAVDSHVSCPSRHISSICNTSSRLLRSAAPHSSAHSIRVEWR